MKKPRSDSKLLNLPDEQASELADWLLSGVSYQKAKVSLKEKFQVETSLAALSSFWDSYCVPVILQRRAAAVTTANTLAEAIQTEPGTWDTVLLQQIKQKAFEMANSPDFKAADLFFIMQLVLKARDQDLKQDQLSLAKNKFEFDAAKAALAQLPALRKIANDKGMDDAAKLQAVRKQLFGVLPE